MKRQEQIQQLFDTFEPFFFEEDERRDLTEETIQSYQPFFDKLEKSKICTIEIQRLNTRIPLKRYNLAITEGLKKFFHNMVEFGNKMDVDSDAHATDGTLEEDSETRMNYFLSVLLNRRLEAVFEGKEIDDFFDYRLDEIFYNPNEDFFYVSWVYENEEWLTFTLS